MAHGLILPASNLSKYQKRENTPIGELKYWGDLLLRGDGKEFLENALHFDETNKQLTTNEMAMLLIMEGVSLEGDMVKVTLGVVNPNGTTEDVYTVPAGKKVIITDYILNAANNYYGYLIVDSLQITNRIYCSSTDQTQQIYLYHEVNEGSTIKVYGNTDGVHQTVIGYLIDK